VIRDARRDLLAVQLVDTAAIQHTGLCEVAVRFVGPVELRQRVGEVQVQAHQDGRELSAPGMLEAALEGADRLQVVLAGDRTASELLLEIAAQPP
jgi:hypothetical protein